MRGPALLASLLVLLSIPAMAAEPAKPVVLQNLEKQGVALRYLGNDNGVNGWVGFQNGQEQYFYATPDGQAIISGIMMNSKGDIVTMRQIQQLREREPSVDKLAADVPPPAPPTSQATAADAQQNPSAKSEQLWADFQSSSWVTLGSKDAPVIYMIVDPKCPHCHEAIDDIRKGGYIEKGQLQLRLIPVGLMDAQSLVQAANLLTVPDPKSAFYQHLDGDKKALWVNEKADTSKIEANIELMRKWKLDVTPFSVYKDKAGKLKILRGRPENLKALVAELK